MFIKQSFNYKLNNLLFKKYRTLSTKISYNWEDPLNLRSCLTDEEKMIQVNYN